MRLRLLKTEQEKNKVKYFCHCVKAILLTLSAFQLNAHGRDQGDELGDRDRYEYNLYDRNYDEVRGRNVYEQEDRAYPEQKYYPNPDEPRYNFNKNFLSKEFES